MPAYLPPQFCGDVLPSWHAATSVVRSDGRYSTRFRAAPPLCGLFLSKTVARAHPPEFLLNECPLSAPKQDVQANFAFAQKRT